MSIDARLRQGLEHSATIVDPDLKATLPDALARGRRRRRLVRASRATAAVAIIALVAVAGTVLLNALRIEQPVTTPTPSVPSRFEDIAGTYTASIESASKLTRDVAGTWSLTLDTDGGLTLIAPPAFESPTASGSFRLHRGVFTTNVFADARCRGTVGTYRWGLSDGRLRFTKIEDPCSIREALFGARIWDSVGASAAPEPVSGGVTFLPDDGSRLASGPYSTTFEPPMRLRISGRWTGNNDTADFVAIQKGSSDADWAISFFRIEHVFDPRTHSEVPVPQDLVGWFTSHPAIHVITPPQPTTIGGLSATWFDVELAPGWNCGKQACVLFAPLSPGEPDLGWSSDGGPNVRARIFVLNVSGASVIVVLESAKGRFHNGLKAAENVLSTVEFG